MSNIRKLKLFFRLSWKTVPSYIMLLLLHTLFSGGQVVLNVVLPKYLIDELTGDCVPERLLAYGGLVVGANLLFAWLNRLMKRVMDVQQVYVSQKMEQLLGEKVMSLPYARLEEPYCLDLKERAAFAFVNQQAMLGMITALAQLLQKGSTLLGLTVIMVTLSPVLMTVLLALIGIMLLLQKRLSVQMRRINELILPINRRYGYYVGLAFGNEMQKDIRLYDMAGMLGERITWYNRDMTDTFDSFAQRKGFYMGLYSVLNDLQAAIAYGYVGLRVITDWFGGRIGLGSFTMYVNAAVQFSANITEFGQSVIRLGQLLGYLTPFMELMELPEEQEEMCRESLEERRKEEVAEEAMSREKEQICREALEEKREDEEQLPREKEQICREALAEKQEGEEILPREQLCARSLPKEQRQKVMLTGPIERIAFENVDFTYPGAHRKVLDRVSFSVKKGEKIAVVGLNGAGKTTLIKLLCRLYHPQSGRILVNGRDIAEYDYTSYMAQLAAVFQDFRLFAFSIEENISCREPGQDREKVENLIARVGLKGKMEELPKGMETLLGKAYDEEGTELSGGQEQKVAIARALYKDASLIILDEPTSALDPMAEAEIYEKFNGLTGGKTAFYISHRMSSSVFCDKVLVLDGGRVADFAPHEELMQKEGCLYRRMFETQAQHFL